MTQPYARELDLDMHNEMGEEISRLQGEVDLLRGRLAQIVEVCDEKHTFPDMALVRTIAATPLTRFLSCGCLMGHERCFDCRPGLHLDQEKALAQAHAE